MPLLLFEEEESDDSVTTVDDSVLTAGWFFHDVFFVDDKNDKEELSIFFEIKAVVPLWVRLRTRLLLEFILMNCGRVGSLG